MVTHALQHLNNAVAVYIIRGFMSNAKAVLCQSWKAEKLHSISGPFPTAIMRMVMADDNKVSLHHSTVFLSWIRYKHNHNIYLHYYHYSISIP